MGYYKTGFRRINGKIRKVRKLIINGKIASVRIAQSKDWENDGQFCQQIELSDDFFSKTGRIKRSLPPKIYQETKEKENR